MSLKRWLRGRRDAREARNIDAVRRALRKLNNGEGYVADIMGLTRLPSGAVYVALLMMQHGKVVESRWDAGSPPRQRRLYRLTEGVDR